MLAEDFNTIRFPYEMFRFRVISRAMEEFSEFIDNYFLIDLPSSGANFTWSRSKDCNFKFWLDKFLVSISYEELAPNVIYFPFSRVVSDHSPILPMVVGVEG